MSTPRPILPPFLTRREALLAAGGAAAVATSAEGADAPKAAPDPRRAAPKRYDMKKSINLWAFPYPERMTLKECLALAKAAGFDGIELNYDLDNDLSPKSGPKEFAAIRKTAEEIGIAISGVCSFLFWPYALTANDPKTRQRGLELATKMTEAAHHLGTENLLVVPGAVYIPWLKDHDPVPNDVCDQRAKEAIAKLLPLAEKLGVYLNIENIFFNGYLMTPGEMNAFVDGFRSKHVRVHFDTGNIMLFMLTNTLSSRTMMSTGGTYHAAYQAEQDQGHRRRGRRQERRRPVSVFLHPLLSPRSVEGRLVPPSDRGRGRMVQAA